MAYFCAQIYAQILINHNISDEIALYNNTLIVSILGYYNISQKHKVQFSYAPQKSTLHICAGLFFAVFIAPNIKSEGYSGEEETAEVFGSALYKAALALTDGGGRYALYGANHLVVAAKVR